MDRTTSQASLEAKRARRLEAARQIKDSQERFSQCVEVARRAPSLPVELRTDTRDSWLPRQALVRGGVSRRALLVSV